MEKIYIEYKDERREAKLTKCQYCNEEFKQRKNGNRLFCSCDCSSKSRGQLIELQCSNCNKIIKRTLSDLQKSRHKRYFCDRKCKEYAQSLKGDCHEIRPKHYGVGTGPSTLRWKIDKQECCDCGIKQIYLLTMHHIDGNRDNNDSSNIEVLCANCHVKRHLKIENGEIVYDTHFLTPREDIKKY